MDHQGVSHVQQVVHEIVGLFWDPKHCQYILRTYHVGFQDSNSPLCLIFGSCNVSPPEAPPVASGWQSVAHLTQGHLESLLLLLPSTTRPGQYRIGKEKRQCSVV